MAEQPTPGVVVSGSGNIVNQHFSNVGNTTTYNIRVGADQDPLRECVVPEAMHDSKDVVDQGTCHPGTRSAVLEDITAWIEHLDPGSALKWMRGAAGAGKSAIARTFANQLANKGLLLGSFFCLRSNVRRSNASMVIPTLVSQITTRIPATRHVIEEAFRSDPLLLTKSTEIQAMRLIIKPLASIEFALHQSLPRVIVIDGLDEIKGAEAQRDILKTVAFLIDNLSFPIHFFIASRPEHQIQDYFTQHMGNRWSYISLDETYQPDRDIIIFYKAHFPLIVAAFPAFKFEPDWPREVARRVLVMKGSGQFIFADIVIRFLGNTSISISPQRRLSMILENVANDKLKPLELLDLVYVTVFEAIPKAELEDVLQLVGLVLLPKNFTKSPRVLDAVLGLEPGTTLNRLRYLHSILKVPSSPDETIAPLHATLGDFIFNRDRSHSFGLHIDQEQLHQAVVLKILEGSMIHTASERLNNCRRDWLDVLYRNSLTTFAKYSTFRTTLASHIKEAQRRHITLWPPLALTETYRVALDALTSHSSWSNIMVNLSWRILETNRKKEVLRRLQSYATIGFTGQLLVFLQLTYNLRSRRPSPLDAFLEALPDQSFLATQKLTGLALPCDGLTLVHTDTWLKSGTFFNQDFVKPFFTLFPWNHVNNFPRDVKPFDLYSNLLADLSPRDRNAYVRRLPENFPRSSSWGDTALREFVLFRRQLHDLVRRQ